MKCYLKIYFIIPILVLNIFSLLHAQYLTLTEGEYCDSDAKTQICKKLANCPTAIEALTQGQPPKMCGITGHETLVCCSGTAQSSDVETTSTSRKPPASTTKPKSTKKSTTARTSTRPATSKPTWNSTSARRTTRRQTTTTPYTTSTDVTSLEPSGVLDVRLEITSVFNPPVESAILLASDTAEAPTNFTTKSAEMCWKYSRYAYIEEKVQGQILGDPDYVMRTYPCTKVESLIVGGVPAILGEFPHMAFLGYGKKIQTAEWMCGGSLVNEKYILTAAHCVENSRGLVKWARLGDLNVDTDSDDQHAEVLEVVQQIKHPDYNPPSLYNDIALLLLNKEVTFSAYKRPLCIQEDMVSNNMGIATGWGRTYDDGEGSSVLLKVSIPLVTGNQCNVSFYGSIGSKLPKGIVPERMICAGDQSGGKDTCQGDSGGPLQIVSPLYKCMYNQIGVTSFGRKCAAPNSPGVYTRVSYYRTWIENIIWPNNSSDVV